MKRVCGFAVTMLLVAAPAVVRAQAPAAAEAEMPRIRISDPNRDLFRIALPNVSGEGGLATEALEIERRAFEVMGLFNLLNPTSFPPDLQREGVAAFNATNWSQVGAQGVVKLSVARGGGGVTLDGRLYQVGRGDAAVLSRSYRGDSLRPLVYTFVNEVIGQLTGKPGPFGSRVAFATVGARSEINSVGADGSEARVLTKMGSESLLPAYSPTGAQIAFTSYLRGTPDLWIVSANGGRARAISKRPGMNSGAVFTRDGRELIVTLSFEGNAELYRIAADDGKVIDRLTRSQFIDMSATLSPSGNEVAFVSDRGGSAQIYTMPASGGQPRRLTFQGSNNTTPRYSPRTDKLQLAFTGRDERGAFDIFIYDFQTQKIERITQNQGSNQSPDWSPDGRLLVYSSSRGGLFVMNIETRKETQIYRGRVNSPSWGPVQGAARP
ncbi:MAG TPA: DPP IV N-terminal domain-containing protein [Polyangia bacterium]